MHRLLSAAVLAILTAAFAGAWTVSASTPNPDHVKQLKETGKCPGCDLREEFLDGVIAEEGDLRDADFRLASMYKVNFRGADLTGAMFTGANLKGADLRDTKGADLLGSETNEFTKCPDGSAGPCK